MNNIKNRKTTTGVEMVRFLAGKGKRIFNVKDARSVAPKVGIRPAYVKEALFLLARNGWIAGIKRGLYLIENPMAGGPPVHEYEIAQALVPNCAISHWSALHYHRMTEQVPRKVFATATTRTWVPYVRGDGRKGGYPVGKTHYQFIRVKPKRFFGHMFVWVGEVKVKMTDVERTLLDGLTMPQFFGGFQEVLHAFEAYAGKVDLGKIIEYVLRLDASVAKRLGWVLEKQGVGLKKLAPLAEASTKSFHKLNPSGPDTGLCNRRWMIRENLGGKGMT
jgi:predicted transcriptional regulator of viral defense system